ncbi:acylphosphatase-1-like [Atheta coriaria]|uniref:acylphosphatase-1-like n=1 Tax=Dalotia coriaria TaxID=877792 RepID=UPI0031F3E6EF
MSTDNMRTVIAGQTFYGLIYLWILLETCSFCNTMSNDSKYISVDFEVYGRVQGVFFRKFTQKQAVKLGLSGWCMNTESGTVQGNMQGTASKIAEMKSWLQNVGSPQSRIDKAVFTTEAILKEKPTGSFSIRR